MDLINIENYNIYLEALQSYKDGDCNEPEAAALNVVIKHAIENKTYIVYQRAINADTHIKPWEVIVIFNFNDDSVFGVYTNRDEPMIEISTKNGVLSSPL